VLELFQPPSKLEDGVQQSRGRVVVVTGWCALTLCTCSGTEAEILPFMQLNTVLELHKYYAYSMAALRL
jgi:hypothetical protein